MAQQNNDFFPATLMAEIFPQFPAWNNHDALDVLLHILGNINVSQGEIAEVTKQGTCPCTYQPPPDVQPNLSVSLPLSASPVNIDQLVHTVINTVTHNGLCPMCQQLTQDNTVTVSQGNYLIVEIERLLGPGPGGQVNNTAVTWNQTAGTRLVTPLFVVGQLPGHWVCYTRHRVTNQWWKLNDSHPMVPQDPFQDHPVNAVIILFRL